LPSTSPFQLALERLAKNRAAVAGAALLSLIALCCIFLPMLLRLDPDHTHPALRNLPPSGKYWFGTDTLGRDLFARVMVGGRTSLLVGLASTAVSVFVGVS
jgi:ABC-type dipeptide/oligopeptide/nickel transport system permease subunit